jgi:alginate O-acetyltransferase complex protein AlgI
MNFVSFEFLLFLLVTWVCFTVAPVRWRAPLLLAASYVFYAFWSLPFITVIVITTSVDYFAGKFIATSTSKEKRKFVLAAAIGLNLSILAIFKYATFILTTVNPVVEKLGMHSSMPGVMNIILPLGISFYTFEAISYLVDVYRGAPAAPSWLKYNFYIMYFPHLISGPIVRFQELIGQYDLSISKAPRRRIIQGLELLILGYVFKVIFADGAALICDPMFANPKSASVFNTYMGAFAFALRVYFDFMGYTHIARGVSLLFNIQLPLNFNHPFSATNISNFWDRWHLSLSRWIRDYLFVPLGGLRHGPIRILFTMIIVMTLAGLWHGAGWTFIVWGLYNGCLLAFYHTYRRMISIASRTRPSLKRFVDRSKIYRVASIVLASAAIISHFVVFGSPNLKTAFILLRNLVRVDQLFIALGTHVLDGNFSALFKFLILILAFSAGPLVVKLYGSYFRPLPTFAKAHAAVAAILLIWIFSAEGYRPFIYFQF